MNDVAFSRSKDHENMKSGNKARLVEVVASSEFPVWTLKKFQWQNSRAAKYLTNFKAISYSAAFDLYVLVQFFLFSYIYLYRFFKVKYIFMW